MACTRRRTGCSPILINSAMCHPVVMDYIGKGRYLQAAASKSLARGYSDRFGTSTSKSLSNEAAENGSRTFLDWTRGIGCNWDEGVFVSGVQGGRTYYLQYLICNECPVPEGEEACTCAAKEGRLDALIWLREREFAWSEVVCTEDAFRGDLPVLEWARKHGCACDGKEVMERAACGGHVSILEWGLQQGFELTDWLTALAAGGGFLHVLEWLKAHNCPWCDSAVPSAAAYGHCHVYLWLKRIGCPYQINAADEEGKTGLHFAALRNFPDMVSVLVQDGADVNAVTEKQKTALHLAALNDRCEIVKLLVSAGALVNAQTHKLTTPLLEAVRRGSLDIVTILLRAGANTELRDARDFVPLTAATQKNHVDIVRALLEAGANPNPHSAKVRTPLYCACKCSYVEVVRALIDWGADVNKPITVKGSVKVYPIHVAAVKGHAQVVGILIKHGADVNISTSNGGTALSLAKTWGHRKVVKILKAAGATR